MIPDIRIPYVLVDLDTPINLWPSHPAYARKPRESRSQERVS